ncbi:MAG: efflux RND transporter periplasmic adaptor subunit [Ancalomicrobiaceae bacterium]|nr:efflux RND transporter periplasmic adaptor subunit [Ancalomicrobiaceae bacterium]
MIFRVARTLVGLILLAAVLAAGYGFASGDIVKWRALAEPYVAAARTKAETTIAEWQKPKPADKPEPVAVARPPAITVTKATRREITETVVVTGSLVPEEEVVVGVDVDGQKIVELDADQGDHVTKGQVLARLDRRSLDVQLAENDAALAKADVGIAQAATQVAQAEFAVTDAQNQVDRTAPLQAKGYATNASLDTQTIALRTAKSRLENSKAGLNFAKADRATLVAARQDIVLKLAKTELKAPTDGIVLSRAAQLGQLASGSAGPLFRIARDGKIELDAEVTEGVMHRMQVGQRVLVSPSGFDDRIEGSVRLITPQVDQATRLGHVRVALPADQRLRAGAFARGEVITARKQAVALPLTAVQVEKDGAIAQVVKDGRISTRRIVTGIRDNGMIEVVSGVQEGDMVVSRAGTFVRDGDIVTPVTETPAAAATDLNATGGTRS